MRNYVSEDQVIFSAVSDCAVEQLINWYIVGKVIYFEKN